MGNGGVESTGPPKKLLSVEDGKIPTKKGGVGLYNTDSEM